jgi:hypothetical protein
MDFPSPASEGQFYTPLNGPQYVYVNGAWRMAGAPTIVATADTRNRIVNGAMQISQENGNTAGTVNPYWPADQWVVSWIGPAISTARDGALVPASGNKRLAISITTGKPSLAAGDSLNLTQSIEGIRMADFLWGTANALPIVVRFWAYTTAPGTYSLAIRNNAVDRSFLAAFTLPDSVWTLTTIAVPGDTTGTWPTDTTRGMAFGICLAAGTATQGAAGWQAGSKTQIAGHTNGAATSGKAFYFGDVGLYLDPLATGIAPPWQMPDEAEELRACQRYYEVLGPQAAMWAGNTTTGVAYFGSGTFTVAKRDNPALSLTIGAQFNFPATVGSVAGSSGSFRESRTANATGNGGYFYSIVTGSARM